MGVINKTTAQRRLKATREQIISLEKRIIKAQIEGIEDEISNDDYEALMSKYGSKLEGLHKDEERYIKILSK